MPYHASQLYSRNVVALVSLLVKDGELKLDWSDEIISGACVARKAGGGRMSAQLVTELTILMLAIFLGFEVISKVPTLLHTPLMSGTNAIHGIVIVGALIVTGAPHQACSSRSFASSRSMLATANVVGGFVVTDRMLEMFKKRREPRGLDESEHSKPAVSDPDSSAFILALKFLSSPKHARLGNQIGAAGMAVAIVVTLLRKDVVTGWWWMLAGGVIGGAIGLVGARKVKMTAMPQMVALFNGVGGGAAALVSLVEFHGVGRDGRRRRRAGHRNRAVGADRVDVLCRLARRLREAAGTDQRPADHVSRAAVRQRRALRRRPSRSAAWAMAGVNSGSSPVMVGAARAVRRSCSSCRSAAPTCRSSSRC